MIETRIVSILGGMSALSGVSLWLQTRLFARLRETHSGEYERIGSPAFSLRNRNTAIDGKGISNSRKFARFLWSGRYRDLGDPEVTRLCRAIKIMSVTILALLPLLIAELWG